MNIAILTFEGFNELDSFIALGILNRMKTQGFNVQITCPSDEVTSMNGLTIKAQQQLEFANTADVVLFGSGMLTRDIVKDESIMARLNLDASKQIIAGQCSGTLIMAKLGLLNKIPACTDLTTTPWVKEAGIEVLNQPLYASGNIATAGGCMASQYLAAWIIAKTRGEEDTNRAIHYVAPVGEKEQSVEHVWSVLKPYV